MIADLKEMFRGVFLRHKGVKTFKYQGDDLNNAQNNYKAFQVYLDDVSYHNLNITTNIFTVELNFYILKAMTQELDLATVQDEAYQIAVDILGYIDYKDEFKGVVSLHDYSIIVLSRYTDDDSAGVKLSIVLEVPSPLNLCELDDNFNDDLYEDDEDKEIDVDDKEVPEELTIKVKKLPKASC